MTNSKTAKGTCLCRKISVEASLKNSEVGVCHCGMCRKWSAGPFLGLDCGSDLKITGTENLGVYSSSEWAERAFCKNCGTSLFYRFKESRQCIASAEIFGVSNLQLDHQIFIDEKPAYYSFSEKTKNMTGVEVFEAFSNQT